MSNSAGSLNGARSHRWVYLLVIVTILTANGCSLSLPWQPVETAQPTQTPGPTQAIANTPTPLPQATAVPLPPALVEVSPLPQSEIGPKTSFTFYFNQPMERGSVQAALAAQPAISGSFEWANDATVKFTPDKTLPLNIDVALSIKAQARAMNGLALTAPVDIAFHTSAGFTLAEQLPKPNAVDADPSSAVVATFTRPMVALGAEATTLPPAFSLEPAARGRTEWLNTSTFIFYPDPPLLGGVEYSVRVNTGLTAADGTPWSGDQKTVDWKFKTSRPSLLSMTPDGNSEIYLDIPILFNFNQPMDPASVQQNLSVKSPGGEAVPGKFTWNESGNQLTFQPVNLLQRAAKYQVTLSGKAQARGGSALDKDFTMVLTTVPNFGVRSSDPANKGTMQMYDVYGGIHIRFTSPLAKQNLIGKFSLQPAIGDLSISTYVDNEVYLSGIFSPRTDYLLTIPAGLQDKWGQSLKEPVQIRFQTPAPSASLGMASLLANNVAFITPRETALSGRATNIKILRVGYAALSISQFAQTASISSYERTQKYAGPRLTNFEKTMDLQADKSNLVDLPLNPTGTAMQPGLYYYQIQSPDITEKNKLGPTSLLLVVSRVHLTIKASQDQLTVWAVNLDTNQPVNGASLGIFTSLTNGDLSQVGTVKTDAQGLAQLGLPFLANNYNPIYVILGKPNDKDFSLAMTSWSQGVSAYGFGLPVDVQVQPQPLHAYIYTDRPIYRPGQQVDFRVMLHDKDNGRYSPADLKQVSVNVMGEFSRAVGERQTIFKTTLPLSEYGTASGSFRLAEDSSPGYYTIAIAEVDGSDLTFQVANYRKPEVDLQTNFSPADLKAGDAIHAAISANYYFGAPAGNLNLHWTLTTRPEWFNLPEGYQTGPVDTGWLLPSWYFTGGGAFVAEGQVRTTPDGKAEINVPGQVFADQVDESRLQRLMLDVILSDEQELPVSAHAEASMHPANLYIGIRSDSWSGQAKKETGFTIQTFDWNKGVVGSRKLTARFLKVVYRQKENWNAQTDSLPFTTELTEIASTDFQVDGQGRARVAFTPPEPGTYQVDVRSEGAVAQLLLWVGGEGRAPWPVLPDNHVRLVNDASDYQAGQTAKILIPNPFGENTLALVTVERAKVMKTEVVQVNAASLEWELPISDEYAPNVYVSVLLIGTGSSGAPEFRQGYSELTVAPRALQFGVELAAQPETAAPGGEVKMGIRVKDSNGKAVQGEFSISVVDKAVLALADPNAPVILESFYGRQPIGVGTSLALAVYGRLRQQDAAQAAGGRGGGGGGPLADQVVRTEFRDTAFWNGAVVTDANGFAEVPVKLPDNLTTWVVTVRGIDRLLRVGEAVREVVVSKDLLVRPVTPRFLVAGDHIQLAALVNNNTTKAINVEVNLQAAGLDLDTPGLATQKVDLPALGRARVTWWGKAQDIDKVDLVFSARGGGLEDASRPSGGSIPVVRYSVPQTFATSGILNEPGEKLEVISPPRSFTPTGGELRVEMSPSLAAVILSGLKALENFPVESAEPTMSRFLANLETYQILQKLGQPSPDLKAKLEPLIQDSITRLISWQNSDGGWGWLPELESNPYLSTYVLFGLSEAARAGIQVNANILKKAGDYINATLVVPIATLKTEQLDRLAFQQYVLQQAGRDQKNAASLYEFRERLSPWARALLALTLSAQSSSDVRTKSLVSDLQAQALRSATGAHWETKEGIIYNLSTPVFTTALVSLALARLDPASTVLPDAVRYLASHRSQNGCWASSYESTWVLMALGEVLRASGELSGSFAFSAELNAAPLITGKAGGSNTLAPVESRVPLQSLIQDQPNALIIRHDTGTGRLYYRAFLQVYRPVEQVSAVDRGLVISRNITMAGQDCTKNACPAVNQVKLSEQRELNVRLTLILPQAMYNLVVEDFIPAGSEIVDASLKTAQRNVQAAPGKGPEVLQYLVSNPFGGGWNWWLFGTPRLYDDHIRWTAAYLAAGTYELTYRLTPLQVGEFHLLPAHAFETYFPEVEGSSAGAVFRIDP